MTTSAQSGVTASLLTLFAALATLNLAAGEARGQSTATAGASSGYAGPTASPGPELGPGRVVEIQIEALRHNDASDQGIAVAFRFASPANKANTGPVGRFARMLHVGPYRLMLERATVAYGPVEIRGDRARRRVTLLGRDGGFAYEFRLSRQSGGDCRGCWMTDAVLAEPLGDRQAHLNSRS
jgi:hypothetical protein